MTTLGKGIAAAAAFLGSAWCATHGAPVAAGWLGVAGFLLL